MSRRHPLRATTSIALLCWLLLRCAAGATDPATHGPFPAGRQTVFIPGEEQHALATDVFFPGTATGGVAAAAGPCPALVLGHGFLQSKACHEQQGILLATRGFIVLIPAFNKAADHRRNGRELSRCLDWLSGQQTNPAALFFQRVRLDRLGAAGHSAGGLSALLAAADDPRIRALSLMDPVDKDKLGLDALSRLSLPVAMTWSEPSSGNNHGSAQRLFAATTGSGRGVKIVGANHTDAQNPSGWLCRLVCGAAEPRRQHLYDRYLVGWFEYHLHDDAAYASWVFDLPGGQVAADLAAGRITYAAPKSKPSGTGRPNLGR